MRALRRRVVVVERAFAVGAGGIVGQNVRLALSGLPTVVYDVVAGLGGRAITKRAVRALIGDVLAGGVEPNRLTFLDLDRGSHRAGVAAHDAEPAPGPHAENILRDIGIVGARAH